jgi:hypothetical protein
MVLVPMNKYNLTNDPFGEFVYPVPVLWLQKSWFLVLLPGKKPRILVNYKLFVLSLTSVSKRSLGKKLISFRNNGP